MICIGDSLTLGMIGHSYIKYCNRTIEASESDKESLRILNKGVNGDTTRCAFERMESYLKKHSFDNHNLYVIAIGTNDILLPYLAGISSAWNAETSLRCRIKKCISDDEIFKEEYEKYFEKISIYNETYPCNRKKMITIGLPYIELRDYPLDLVYRHNEIICELSQKYGVPFIDICSIQGNAAKALGWPDFDSTKSYTWKHKNISRLIDNFAMLVCPPVKDLMSRARGLSLTVDGVHYNSLSASLLGKKLAETEGSYPKAKPNGIMPK